MNARIAVALAAALALAPAASAQDAPPPTGPAAPAKHENKITDAAKAAFEKMEKAAYSAVAAGLKDLSGTVDMAIEGGEAGAKMQAMGGMNASFQVSWKAGEELKVEPKGEPQGPMKMMVGNMKNMAGSMLRMGLGLMKPAEGEEYDADAVVEGGKTVLTIIHYKNGAETSRAAMTLDDRGLIESVKATSKAAAGGAGGPPGGPGAGHRGAPGGEEPAIRYTWKKEGDRWLLEKMSAQAGPRSFEMTPVYTDAGGFKLLTSWSMGGGMGGMTFGFRFTDLVVNGKPVTLPTIEAGKTQGGEGGMGGETK